MEAKKEIQKNDRKGTGAGLAAGIRLENKTQREPDATDTAEIAMREKYDKAVAKVELTANK